MHYVIVVSIELNPGDSWEKTIEDIKISTDRIIKNIVFTNKEGKELPTSWLHLSFDDVDLTGKAPVFRLFLRCDLPNEELLSPFFFARLEVVPLVRGAIYSEKTRLALEGYLGVHLI